MHKHIGAINTWGNKDSQQTRFCLQGNHPGDIACSSFIHLAYHIMLIGLFYILGAAENITLFLFSIDLNINSFF